MVGSDTPSGDERTVVLSGRGQPATGSGDGEALAPGTALGRYRIEALLGRGGMGEVYLAEQLQPVRRKVALKLLRGRRLDVRGLGHVEIEQQLLAQMRHPAIAQIYDAGVTAQGDPYFAMEYIDGVPVTGYCRENALPLRARIELFIRICEGVQHAHQKGVVHRDLKPANILVTAVDGRALPRIIDFGIATAAARGGGAGAGAGDDASAGTPHYMSPEQADDPASVDTRSDVYALGVLLHEVVAGERPAAEGGEGGDRPAVLRGELAWVVDKAMQRDRDARYASAAALAEDLQRMLDDLPVRAAPPGRRYAWGKFARRHRIALTAGTAVAAALLAGLGLSLYGLVEARQQRALVEERSAELEKVVAFQQAMLEEVDVEAMGVALADGLRERVGRVDPGALAGLDAYLGMASTVDVARELVGDEVLARAGEVVARDFAGEPALAADLRAALGRVYTALGMPEQAAGYYRQVLEWREAALGRGAAETLDARARLAGALREQSHYEPARAALEASLDAALALPPGEEARVRYELELAQLDLEQGDLEGAERRQREVVARLRDIHGDRHPLVDLAGSQLAITLARSGGLDEARALMEALYAQRLEAMGPDHRDTLAAMGTLAALRAMLADTEGALELQRRLVAAHGARLGREHPVTLVARGNLANMLSDAGQSGEALAEAAAVHEARTRVLGADHPQTVRALLNLSALHARVDDFDAALPLEREVIEARRRILGPRHPDTLFVMINHGMTLVRAERPAAARGVLQEALADAGEVLGEQHPQFRRGMMFLGQARLELGEAAGAAEILRDTLRMQRRHLGDDAPDTAWTAWNLMRALQAGGRQAEAEAVRDEILAPLLEADPATLGVAMRNIRGDILAAMEEAGPLAAR